MLIAQKARLAFCSNSRMHNQRLQLIRMRLHHRLAFSNTGHNGRALWIGLCAWVILCCNGFFICHKKLLQTEIKVLDEDVRSLDTDMSELNSVRGSAVTAAASIDNGIAGNWLHLRRYAGAEEQERMVVRGTAAKYPTKSATVLCRFVEYEVVQVFTKSSFAD